MGRSLRIQISLTIVIIVLLTVSVISYFSNRIIQQNFEKYIMGQQITKVDDLVTLIESRYDFGERTWDAQFIHGVGMYALSDGYILKVYDDDNGVIWDAENHDTTLCSQIMTEVTERMKESRPDVEGSFTASEYALNQNGQQIGRLSVSCYSPYFFSDNDYRFLDALNLTLITIGILSLILSLAAGTVLARWIARPIAKTAYISKQISAGNYSIRFEGKTRIKELDELAQVINQLADDLDAQENLRKHITEDVGHELRTPLTTIASHLEAMIEGIWEPTPERLQSCYEEIERLTGLAADLERLARVESENISLNKEYIDLYDIAYSVTANFASEMSKKNLSPKIEGGTVFVLADRDRISQVVTNLITNAVKFSHEGGDIKVVLSSENNYGILTVEDQGVGIPEENQPYIFERFYRADQSRSRQTGGAGIGLAIVKSIVDAHKGEIKVVSEIGKGSSFTIKLPQKQREVRG